MNIIKMPYEIYEKCEEPFMIYPFNYFIFDDFEIITNVREDFIFDNYGKSNSGTIVEKYSCKITQVEEWGKIYDELNFSYQGIINGKPTKKHEYLLFLEEDTKEVASYTPIDYETNMLYGDMTDLEVYTLLNMLGYVMQEGIKRQREVRKSGGKKYKYSREHRISIPSKKIYLFDDIVNYVSDNYVPGTKTHNIQCPCWEVRGHYRHYKSGKVVFIKSFKKGKHKETVKSINHEYYVGRTVE